MEKEKKAIYKKWWFWVIIVVIILGIGSSLNNNSTETSTQQNTSSSLTENKKQSEKTEYNKGEEAILGNGAITVTDVQISQGTQYDKPKSGKEFVIVSVTIENKGDKNLYYNPYYFKMQNSQGQQEDIAFTTVNNDNSLQSGELIPGGKVSGTIAFEQPIGDAGLVLIYSNNLWSSKELKIKL